MSHVTDAPRRSFDGLTRREVLRLGGLPLAGLSLPRLLANDAAPAPARAGRKARAKSCLLVFLEGGPSHIDLWDMKPDAPAEVRGEFKPIATKTPGLQVSEHLPRLAARAERLAIVRSLSHREYNHLTATHQVLTGSPMPGGVPDKVASRSDWPCH